MTAGAIILAASMYDVLLGAAIVVPICLVVGWLSMLVYYDSRGMDHEFRFAPSLFPWTEAARLRKIRLQAMIESEREKLYDAKFRAKQKQMVFAELEERQIQESIAHSEERGLPR